MTDPMSPEELRACRERAEAATPGPWGFKLGNLKAYVFSLDDGEDLGFSLQLQHWKDGRDVPSAENAAFIAGAREDVPRLLATIAARDARLEAVAAVLAAEGCGCGYDHRQCECDYDVKCDHGDPCLACRIEAAMKGASQ